VLGFQVSELAQSRVNLSGVGDDLLSEEEVVDPLRPAGGFCLLVTLVEGDVVILHGEVTILHWVGLVNSLEDGGVLLVKSV